jgi:hypothetical protein
MFNEKLYDYVILYKKRKEKEQQCVMNMRKKIANQFFKWNIFLHVFDTC